MLIQKKDACFDEQLVVEEFVGKLEMWYKLEMIIQPVSVALGFHYRVWFATPDGACVYCRFAQGWLLSLQNLQAKGEVLEAWMHDSAA